MIELVALISSRWNSFSLFAAVTGCVKQGNAKILKHIKTKEDEAETQKRYMMSIQEKKRKRVAPFPNVSRF